MIRNDRKASYKWAYEQFTDAWGGFKPGQNPNYAALIADRIVPLLAATEIAEGEESAEGREEPAEEREEILVPFALNDRPGGEDKLDYDDYAKAFAQVLANPDTRTPITIGIYGSWGMGKSFLMGKIEKYMRAIKEGNEKKRRASKANRAQYPDFHFVEFNAWVYSGSENLWAGLITRLFGEVEKFFGPRKTSFYLLRKNLRSMIAKTIGLLLVYGALGVALSVLLDYNTLQSNWDTFRIALNALAGSAIAGSAIAALPALLKAIRDLFSNLALVRSEQFAALSSRRDFRDKIGFMADIKEEVHSMRKMLDNGKDGSPIRFVIFIDDLDRCPPGKAVEVLEAIMLLLADEDGTPFIIFLAIDARVIVKAIEERYGKILVEAGITGYEYLDKIVQIPFSIPPPRDDVMKQYVTSLLWRSEAERQTAEKGQKEKEREKEEKERKRQVERDLREAQAKAAETIKAADVEPAAGELIAPPVSKESAPQSETAPLSAGMTPAPVEKISPPPEKAKAPPVEVPFKLEERQAFEDFSRYFSPNPRRAKRIVNIYRVARLLTPQATSDERQKLIKWVILSEQWPYRTAWMIQQIEDDFQVKGVFSKRPSAPMAEVFSAVRSKVVADSGKAFAGMDDDREHFEQFIADPPVLTADDIQRMKRFAFNLNPALQAEVLKASSREPQARRRGRAARGAPPQLTPALQAEVIKASSREPQTMPAAETAPPQDETLATREREKEEREGKQQAERDLR